MMGITMQVYKLARSLISGAGLRAISGAFMVATMGAPAQAATPDPLFASDAPLAITLTGPFKAIDKSRDKDAEYAGGMLRYQGPDGEVSIEANYAPRGNFRLDKRTCTHAQLWLDLKKKQTRDTLFANQNKLKLVLQCRDSKRYASYLRKEYDAYRMLNLLTDNSFRVRWVEVTYQDESGKTLRTQPAFFIEHKKRLANRLSLNTVDEDRIRPSQLEPSQATTVALFNYFVGNADFSIIAGREGSCCHNAKLLQADNDSPYLPFIYDFDSSGYVNAPYATTPANLDLRSVRQRIYRGFCAEDAVIDEALGLFRSHREALLAIAGDTQILSKREAKKAVAYLEDFFDIIDNPKKLNREIIEDCRPW